jgi:PAS domain S-box-containing protein
MIDKSSPPPEGLNKIVDELSSAIHMVNDKLEITFANQKVLKWCKEAGIPTDIIGKTLFEAFPFLQEKVRDEYKMVFESGQPLMTEETTEVNGIDHHTTTRKTPLFKKDKVHSVVTIVTEAEYSTHDKDEPCIFQSLCDRANHGIATVTTDGEIVYLNDAFASMHGYAREELIGKNISLFHTKEQLPRAKALLEQQITRGWFSCEELWHVKRDGTVFPTLMSGTTITPKGHESPLLSATAIDISHYHKTESKLSIIEQSINRASPSIFWVSNEGKFLFANETACQKLGYSQEELREMYVHDIDPYHTKDVRPQRWDKYRQFGVATFESFHQSKDGKIYPVEIVSHHLEINGEEMEFAFATDISARRAAENALRESEERYRALFNASPNSILVAQDGKYVLANPKTCQLYGYSSPEELIGKDFLETIAPHHRDIIKSRAAKAKEGVTNPHLELDIIKKDGTIATVESVSVPITWKDRPAALIIGQDLTEKKNAAAALRESEERYRSLEEQLRHAQKMEAIGTLAGGIAHDFNNILSAIFGFADIAACDAGDNEEVVETLEELIGAAHRAKDLVKQILAFSRQNKVHKRPLRVQKVAAEACRLLRSTIPTTIKFETDLSSKCGFVLADATQIHQVLINLGTNAFHAMEDSGGILTINVRQIELSTMAAAGLVNINAGPHVEITVQDTGIGMSPKTQERIFDPYFTTKEIGKGTGLGMSTVHSIIAEHEGSIQVQSQEGEGTRITILLPISKNVSSNLKPEDDDEILPFGTERILYVDDEAPILQIAKASLERYGYQLTTDNDPQLALQRFKEKPQAFDLIVTDQNMPNITGYDLALKIMKIRKDIPIILCTGFSRSISEEKALAAGISEFAMKPIVGKQLATTIRRVLDKKN